MSRIAKLRPLFIAIIVALTLTGCGQSEDDTSLPWSTPAAWEGQAPMMGGVSV